MTPEECVSLSAHHSFMGSFNQKYHRNVCQQFRPPHFRDRLGRFRSTGAARMVGYLGFPQVVVSSCYLEVINHRRFGAVSPKVQDSLLLVRVAGNEGVTPIAILVVSFQGIPTGSFPTPLLLPLWLCEFHGFQKVRPGEERPNGNQQVQGDLVPLCLRSPQGQMQPARELGGHPTPGQLVVWEPDESTGWRYPNLPDNRGTGELP